MNPRSFARDSLLRMTHQLGARDFQSVELVIVGSESGKLDLATSLPFIPAAGDRYELIFPDESPILAIRHILQLPRSHALPDLELRLGTTRGTNALLTRTGARVAFITTRGFRDCLEIGYQDRPHLFDLDIKKEKPLYCEAIEVDERISAEGDVLLPLQKDVVRAQLEALRQVGVESLAICLLNAYVRAEHRA